ncbi:MAG TPA: HAD-IA family hydrolase [Thermoanaerobaculia bacterium]|nr:HAD-IA family hydrolase [Thermoanaerobaculia bacterium]
MTRALLVDLGKVLVGFDHQVTCEKMSKATGVPAGRLRGVLFGELEGDFDRGRLTPGAFFRACEARLGILPVPDETWIAAWRDIFTPLPEAIAALGRVRPGIRRVLVSNTNVLHWEGVLSVFRPDALLDDVVLSFRVGATKPEPAFWDAALAAAGCGPAACVYADDRPELVAAASALGIPGFVVDSPASLARGLARFDLLAPSSTASGNSPAATDVPRR